MDPASTQPDLKSDLASLWEDIGKIRIGMVTTRDGKLMRSRPMLAFADKAEGALYFFTRASDHKVTEVEDVEVVCIVFVDSRREIYVSVTGTASVVIDRAKAAEHWSPSAIVWFEGGIDDPNLRLIRVDVQQAERWGVNTNPLRKIWEIVRSYGNARTPELTKNTKFRAARS